ncbi:MAG: 16S rRNA (guanine(527)-N(7))-methyltransferase RsmG [Opitutales bacterium]
MDELVPLFPEVATDRWEALRAMAALHREWNAKINLVSRKDMDRLEWHHYAPCLASVKFLKLMDGARVIDVGTGGGFPGLILAALHPKARFTLVDSVGKKIAVVRDIADRLGLKNIETLNARAETLRHEHDFVTGRAVADLRTFVHQTRQLVGRGQKHSLPNGILYWQGGDAAEEAAKSGLDPAFTFELRPLLRDDPKFEGKRVVLYRAQDLARCRRPDPPA